MNYSCFLENQGIYDCNLYDMVSYLVSLYYRTNCKYECTRRKINRLLTIYKLCCNKNGYKCFENKFYIGEPYSHITALVFMYREVYYTYKSIEYDENSLFGECILDLNDKGQIDKMPTFYKKYYEENKVSEQSKKLLEDIFKKFGGFKFSKIAEDIDDIMDNIPTMPMADNMKHIDENRINEFFYSETNKNLFKDNIVFEFIRNYNIEKVFDEKNEQYFNCDKVQQWFCEKFINLSLESQKKLLDYIENYCEENNKLTENRKPYFINPKLPK